MKKPSEIGMLEIDLPFKELDESLKRYIDAKLKVATYRKRLSEEAEAIFPYFVKYAKAEKRENQASLPSILDNFCYEVLGLSGDKQDKSVRASLTRRFKKLMRKYVSDDPKYQIKLDKFINEDQLLSLSDVP